MSRFHAEFRSGAYPHYAVTNEQGSVMGTFTDQEMAAGFAEHLTRSLAPPKADEAWVLLFSPGKGYWRPNQQGYTESVRDAGRYSPEDAVAIVTSRNGFFRPAEERVQIHPEPRPPYPTCRHPLKCHGVGYCRAGIACND
jgi:hypothetical protein